MHCVDNCSIKEVSQKFLLSTGVIKASAKPILESNGTGAVQSDCRYTIQLEGIYDSVGIVIVYILIM